VSISKEAKVAILVIIAGVTLYFGFNYLNGIDFFKDTKKYYVIYSNVGGLNISNQVMLNGFNVGRVSNIRINQVENNVQVELELEESIILGKESLARLHSDLLGTKSIILVIKSIESPIEPGDTIMGMLDKGIEEIIKESTQPVAASLEITMSKINALLDNFQGSGDKVKATMDNLDATLISIKRLSDRNTNRLSLLIDNLNILVEGLSETTDILPEVLEKFGSAADSLKAIRINNTLVQMNKTLKEMEIVMASINSGEGSLGKLIKQDTLYNNLNQSLISLDTLLQHMNSNPKHFFAPLGKSRKKIEKDLKEQKEKGG